MHEFELLKSFIIILGASAVVVFLLHRIKIPSIVGFLLAGMLLGPYGVGFIKDSHTIQTFAEIGVILLLFTIGLQFSLSRSLKMKAEIFGIGGLQVSIAVALTAFISYRWLETVNTAIFVGFLVALSSTAIVMKLLSERSELESPHGRISVGILIFQDLCVVPFMLLVPIMSVGGGKPVEFILTLAKALGIIALVLLSARWLVPNILHQIVHTRSRELFVITILILCFGTAFITSEFGLSLALGAFLAGLVISESEYAHETTSVILPFKDSFSGLFFVSIGMLMNVSFFIKNLFLIISIVAGIIVLKWLSVFLSIYLTGRSIRTSIQSGVNLAQIGEFSFVLALAGLSSGLITDSMYQTFLSASVLSMLLTPLMMWASPFIASRLSSQHLLKRLESIKELSGQDEFPRKRSGHVIIIGFGLNGRNLAKVLKETDIPYAVLDLNNDIVRKMKKKGEPVYYGDGTKIETLQRLGIKAATILVVAISDPLACRNIVQTARKQSQNSELLIIARTHYTSEIDDLLKLGADDVIPLEFETSIEIFSRVLSIYQTPREVISRLINDIRQDGYKMLRQTEITTRKHLLEKYAVLSHIEMEVFVIKKDSAVLGKSIKELNFRSRTGATIISIERNKQMYSYPSPEFTFEEGDTVFISGNKENISKAINYIAEG